MEAAKNRFVKIDGSGDLLPGKRQVRSLRAGVGSSITTHRVRMTIYEDRRTVMAIYYQASGTFVLSGQELAALSLRTELG